MPICVATANYYYLPFEQTLEIIAQAGFQWIELDLYWERGKWAMAQHLKGMSPGEVVRLIHQAGLQVATLHDGGGVVENENSICGFINPALNDYLDQLGYAPECITFHTPHIVGNYDEQWWRTTSPKALVAVREYLNRAGAIAVENMAPFDGCSVPLTKPHELLSFVSQSELKLTIDTTHYAQLGVDIVHAAEMLKERVATVHLSDYRDGASHVFVGDGSLDFGRLFRALKGSELRSVTLECSAGFFGENVSELDQKALIDRLRIARSRVNKWVLPNAEEME